MNTFEVIGIDKRYVDVKEQKKYRNVFAFDDCFNIFDVYNMLRTYFEKKEIPLNFKIRQL